jgi:hypothetical protein
MRFWVILEDFFLFQVHSIREAQSYGYAREDVFVETADGLEPIV